MTAAIPWSRSASLVSTPESADLARDCGGRKTGGAMVDFDGFPEATRQFLAGIAENNSKDWFDANRALYEEGYVGAGRAFVEAVGPNLRTISRTVHFEPRVNGSISRVNRDTRFSRDK